ncbi:hypothetical protein K438DRAFT_1750458 [Mycena galopus ATCC 62051]|nr:hypothetical protein K438DRAFT_1750458 [Mycena galopus ATCC 62051]
MADHYLHWIWSKYTISPDPASGMQSLHQTCSTFIKHVLRPSQIILLGGGYALHPDVAAPLGEIIPVMIHLLHLAAKHCGLQSSSTLREADIQILTRTTGLFTPATQNQIVWHWTVLMEELYVAMVDLKSLCHGYSIPGGGERPSRMPQILFSLPPSLRAKLPKGFLHSYGFSTSHAPLKAPGPSAKPSLLDRAASIASKKSLDLSDIVDRGIDMNSRSDHRPLGRFALYSDVLLSTEDTVNEMQAVLTDTFSRIHSRSTCFLVDPHNMLMQSLRGANDAHELHLAWDALTAQMDIAQRRLKEYQQEYEAGGRLPAHCMIVDPPERSLSTTSRTMSSASSEAGQRAPFGADLCETRPSVKTPVANIESTLVAEAGGPILTRPVAAARARAPVVIAAIAPWRLDVNMQELDKLPATAQGTTLLTSKGIDSASKDTVLECLAPTPAFPRALAVIYTLNTLDVARWW